MKLNKKEIELLLKLNKKAIELLLKITPTPIGEGLTLQEAAKDLGIARSSAYNRLTTFRKNHPGAYENFMSMFRAAKRQQRSLKNPTSLGSGDCLNFKRIVEKF